MCRLWAWQTMAVAGFLVLGPFQALMTQPISSYFSEALVVQEAPFVEHASSESNWQCLFEN